MKCCVCCGSPAKQGDLSCAKCGEASWGELLPAPLPQLQEVVIQTLPEEDRAWFSKGKKK